MLVANGDRAERRLALDLWCASRLHDRVFRPECECCRDVLSRLSSYNALATGSNRLEFSRDLDLRSTAASHDAGPHAHPGPRAARRVEPALQARRDSSKPLFGIRSMPIGSCTYKDRPLDFLLEVSERLNFWSEANFVEDGNPLCDGEEATNMSIVANFD